MGMHTILLVLTALMLAACAGEAPSSSSEAEPVELLDTDLPQEPPAQQEPERCGAVFTPDAELLEETTAAAARWALATGCDVRVGEGGIPVRLVDVVIDSKGNPVSNKGLTIVREDLLVIYVQVTRDRDSRAVPHELGHALYPVAREEYPCGHVQPEVEGESCDALMCGNGGRGFITTEDLVAVCEGFPCTTMIPER